MGKGGEMKSIMQNDFSCWMCGSNQGLELHHCIHGRRKLCEKYGLIAYLCVAEHKRVHLDKDFGLIMKQAAQNAFEREHGSREEFIRIFGRSWL